MREDDEDYSSDDPYPSSLKPYWSRRPKYEHEIDILLAVIAGAVLMGLLMWKFLR